MNFFCEKVCKKKRSVRKAKQAKSKASNSSLQIDEEIKKVTSFEKCSSVTSLNSQTSGSLSRHSFAF